MVKKNTKSKKLPTQKVDSKQCPQCKVIAKGHKEIDDVFGFRNMGNIIRPQSNCRKCRSAHHSKMRKLKGGKKAYRGLDLRTSKAKKKLGKSPKRKNSIRATKKKSATTKKSKGKKKISRKK